MHFPLSLIKWLSLTFILPSSIILLNILLSTSIHIARLQQSRTIVALRSAMLNSSGNCYFRFIKFCKITLTSLDLLSLAWIKSVRKYINSMTWWLISNLIKYEWIIRIYRYRKIDDQRMDCEWQVWHKHFDDMIPLAVIFELCHTIHLHNKAIAANNVYAWNRLVA